LLFLTKLRWALLEHPMAMGFLDATGCIPVNDGGVVHRLGTFDGNEFTLQID
jgi:hypothetical protein